MSLKSAIAGFAAVAIVAATALMPTAASAQRGHGFARGGVHAGGGFRGFRGGGFRGFRGGYGGWGGVGVYPWWGYEGYPGPYFYGYGPSCGYVHVKYYRNHRAYWHWVYVCQ